MPTADRSASAAMIRKIIRRVDMRQGLPPKQQSYAQPSNTTFIRFVNWRNATSNRNIRLPKNTTCGC